MTPNGIETPRRITFERNTPSPASASSDFAIGAND
jgi:hypothetical protein